MKDVYIASLSFLALAFVFLAFVLVIARREHERLRRMSKHQLLDQVVREIRDAKPGKVIMIPRGVTMEDVAMMINPQPLSHEQNRSPRPPG